ncbi:fructose-bisphosphatase class III [Companilactobacillus sp. FL22-1]|uniref:fructose-bisphosphatase class III n=1 Tax=Companilactobacillus sp. FL22-1 TaxID=3373892 RepID=UPI0037545747
MDEDFIDVDKVKTKIVNLAANLHLPKGTEAFISDIHGNSDNYLNIVRSGAGNVSRKVEEVFNGRLTDLNQQKLVCLIYYPEEILPQIRQNFVDEDSSRQWSMDTINRLIEVMRYVADKYPRNIVEDAMDSNLRDIARELFLGNLDAADKQSYYREMIKSLVNLKMSDEFIIATCHAIQKLAIERIHILGDLYDRGSHPDGIINQLNESWQNFDFEWGNHDVLWMGSLAGSKLCMLNVVRICARYHNLGLLKNVYGIDLTSIVKFAMNSYRPLPNFEPLGDLTGVSDDERNIDNCVQQAAAIMQFKLEGQAIKRNPEFGMENRLLLDKISPDKKSLMLDGKSYPLKNGCFQNVNPAKPYQIIRGEQNVIIDLINQFIRSSQLNEHMWFMFDNGSMYHRHNGNLLFHGCVPTAKDGSFIPVKIDGEEYSGKALFDKASEIIRDSLRHPTTGDCFNSDFMWYLWEGKNSPLFGKNKMATFERYFVEDQTLQNETPNPFYKLSQQESFADKIMEEFSINSRGHIIIGHTPTGEIEPIKANKKIIVVNGLSELDYGQHDIGGFALLFDSFGMRLETLKKFDSSNKTVAEMSDVVLDKQIIEHYSERRTVADTDYGTKIKEQIEDLSTQLD